MFRSLQFIARTTYLCVQINFYVIFESTCEALLLINETGFKTVLYNVQLLYLHVISSKQFSSKATYSSIRAFQTSKHPLKSFSLSAIHNFLSASYTSCNKLKISVEVFFNFKRNLLFTGCLFYRRVCKIAKIDC